MPRIVGVRVGEVVKLYSVGGLFTLATVVRRTFWDLVDLELRDGTVLRDVRHVIVVDGEMWYRDERWERLDYSDDE